jgi:GH24 family phage-related lysozyme (muramidase)
MNRVAIQAHIRKHEGCQYTAYDDSLGVRTVGIGFNLTRKDAKPRIEAMGLDYDLVYQGRVKLADAHCNALLNVDVEDAIDMARALLTNFNDQPDDVQLVIVDMIYNMGGPRFAKFEKTLAALEADDYCKAAIEMRNSKWAEQVPNRAAADIAIMMRHCEKQTWE